MSYLHIAVIYLLLLHNLLFSRRCKCDVGYSKVTRKRVKIHPEYIVRICFELVLQCRALFKIRGQCQILEYSCRVFLRCRYLCVTSSCPVCEFISAFGRCFKCHRRAFVNRSGCRCADSSIVNRNRTLRCVSCRFRLYGFLPFRRREFSLYNYIIICPYCHHIEFLI